MIKFIADSTRVFALLFLSLFSTISMWPPWFGLSVLRFRGLQNPQYRPGGHFSILTEFRTASLFMSSPLTSFSFAFNLPPFPPSHQGKNKKNLRLTTMLLDSVGANPYNTVLLRQTPFIKKYEG
ncbi:MAG: hypothetical protein ACE5G1_14985 [bacterium]